MAAAVRSLRENEERSGQLVERARAFAEEHRRDRQASRLASLLEEVAGLDS
jgi:hypothetical protein